MTLTLDSLCEAMGIDTRPVGIYDAPDPRAFEPIVPLRRCLFDHYQDWQDGKTVTINPATQGCPGSGYWLTGTGRFPSREAMVCFLTDKEGIRETRELTEAWLAAHPVPPPRHGHILIGPVRDHPRIHLRTVTFFVNPDQLAALVFGAAYHAHPGDPEPVMAPFGSGCGQMLNLFQDLERPQAAIGGTDLAMRHHLPADRLAFTVTVPMLERLLRLDDGHSFLEHSFLAKLRASRNP